MPKPYSLDLRERVFRYVDEGHSCRAAAAHFRVSVSFVVNLVKAFIARAVRERGRCAAAGHDDNAAALAEIIGGSAARQQLKVPKMLVSTSRRHSSGSTVQIGP
jgi:hypothetical protein